MDDFLRNPESYRLKNIPPEIYYVPNFITISEEEKIITEINGAPKPKWTQLLDRRLQNWGGTPYLKGMVAEQIPLWLQTYMNYIHCLGIMDGRLPNHCLVNEYLPGQGIMPHVDGSIFYPTVTTISCGSQTIIKFRENPSSDRINPPFKYSILLERRSLFVMQKNMYEEYQHCIEGKNVDMVTHDILNLSSCSSKYSIGESLERGTRLSLTIRHVPNTSKLKMKF